MCVYLLTLFVVLPTTEGIDVSVFDFREATIAAAFEQSNNSTSPPSYPSLDVAAVLGAAANNTGTPQGSGQIYLYL